MTILVELVFAIGARIAPGQLGAGGADIVICSMP